MLHCNVRGGKSIKRRFMCNIKVFYNIYILHFFVLVHIVTLLDLTCLWMFFCSLVTCFFFNKHMKIIINHWYMYIIEHTKILIWKKTPWLVMLFSPGNFKYIVCELQYCLVAWLSMQPLSIWRYCSLPTNLSRFHFCKYTFSYGKVY